MKCGQSGRRLSKADFGFYERRQRRHNEHLTALFQDKVAKEYREGMKTSKPSVAVLEMPEDIRVKYVSRRSMKQSHVCMSTSIMTALIGALLLTSPVKAEQVFTNNLVYNYSPTDCRFTAPNGLNCLNVHPLIVHCRGNVIFDAQLDHFYFEPVLLISDEGSVTFSAQSRLGTKDLYVIAPKGKFHQKAPLIRARRTFRIIAQSGEKEHSATLKAGRKDVHFPTIAELSEAYRMGEFGNNIFWPQDNPREIIPRQIHAECGMNDYPNDICLVGPKLKWAWTLPDTKALVDEKVQCAWMTLNCGHVVIYGQAAIGDLKVDFGVKKAIHLPRDHCPFGAYDEMASSFEARKCFYNHPTEFSEDTVASGTKAIQTYTFPKYQVYNWPGRHMFSVLPAGVLNVTRTFKVDGKYVHYDFWGLSNLNIRGMKMACIETNLSDEKGEDGGFAYFNGEPDCKITEYGEEVSDEGSVPSVQTYDGDADTNSLLEKAKRAFSHLRDREL